MAVLFVFATAVIPYVAAAKDDEEHTESTETTELTDPDDNDNVDENEPPPPPDDEDPDAPIDGGLGILIAGGIGYGIKHIQQRRKHRQENPSK